MCSVNVNIDGDNVDVAVKCIMDLFIESKKNCRQGTFIFTLNLFTLCLQKNRAWITLNEKRSETDFITPFRALGQDR